MLRVLFLIVIVAGPSFAETAAEAFERGLASYQKQDYPAARDAFEATAKLGSPTPRLLHNMALTYVRLNEKARALGLWRKALVLDPNFTPARAGRDLLEVGERMRPFEGEGVQLALRHVLERVSPFVLSWILAVALTLSAWSGLALVARRRRAREEDLERPGFSFGLAAAVAMAGVVGATLWLRLDFELERRATIVGDAADVRSLPSARAVSLFVIKGGHEVRVRRRQEGWSQVQSPEGTTGWVPDADLLPTSDI